jgi:hypothetical protein
MGAEVKVLGLEVTETGSWMNVSLVNGFSRIRVDGVDDEHVFFDRRVASVRLIPGAEKHISGFTGQEEFRVPRALHQALCEE